MAKLSLIAEKKIDQIEEIRVGFLSISRICVCGVFLSASLNCILIVWFNCTLSVCECLPNSTPHTFPIVSCGENSSLGLAPELLQKVTYKNTWILSSEFGKYISLLKSCLVQGHSTLLVQTKGSQFGSATGWQSLNKKHLTWPLKCLFVCCCCLISWKSDHLNLTWVKKLHSGLSSHSCPHSAIVESKSPGASMVS